ncbi:hypothetical protein HB779_05965 [Phyllobacterium sp. 628]|uniref:hypothetical protein n=1 Tax=Phyllobacterium sp. 628 TaxID=2718938 RepID=UPI0016622B60|nr:hypothetical protein [Phyllobacterium sp. 628]QND51493.1 hypothetical protein HB779_05965 [Phyllobacterium sp. 628]
MMQWIKPGTRRACLFGALLAVLAGCDGDGNTGQQSGTFETDASQVAATDQSQVEQKPVVGTVTPVPGTDSLPVTSGGEAISLVDPNKDSQIIVPPPALVKATRFTEIAPDTTGGATYHSSPALEYDLGNLVAQWSDDAAAFTSPSTFITPVRGWIRYPEKPLGTSSSPDKYPVIIFLHGQHDKTDPSYEGYDYLAKDLAEHGYVVLSIDANAINTVGDDSSQSRAQLILGTLDRMREIDGFGQIDLGANLGKLDPLKGKLDFTRVGIIGHSRGGQGVANTILFNEIRSGVREEELKATLLAKPSNFQTAYPELAAAVTPAVKAIPATEATATVPATPASLDPQKFRDAIIKYNIFYASGTNNANGNAAPFYMFKGAFLVGPTDSGGNQGLSNVPLAALLPSCDGDVFNLHGASTYDRNRFGRAGDTAPRYQIMVNGANHNDYNTIWTKDDFADAWWGKAAGPAYCYRRPDQKDSIRLTAEDQRRTGLFIINSFMRYHVGGEQKFAPWWNGHAQLPEAVCPGGKGTCDERVELTVQKADSLQKTIQRFEWVDSLKRNVLGGAITLVGFDYIARCDTPSVANVGGNCLPKRLPDFKYHDWEGYGLFSIADHAELVWSKPNATITTDLVSISAASYDSLTFRIAVVRPMGQEVMVTLTDSTGKTATVAASDFSNALYNGPRVKKGGDTPKDQDLPMVDDPADAPYASGQVKILMNMVAIPLKAFEGVDMTKLKELKLSFPKESGKVAITDIELQNLGRDKPMQTAAQ